MSLLSSALRQCLCQAPEHLDQLAAFIDPAWIEQALTATGKVSIRRRKLPAEHAVWLVIGLALFRNLPLWQVVDQLALCLDNQPLAAPSSSVQARQRLGHEPLEHLFQLLANAWTRPASPPVCTPSLRVLAVDGCVWSAPDTPDNRASLGSSHTQHGPGSWPQVRAVCLMDAQTHGLLDARIGGMTQGELTLAAHLQVPEHTLTVFDRAYFSAAFLSDWHAQGEHRHWLIRAKDNLRHEVVKTLAEGDWLVQMPVSPRARKLHPHLPALWQARLVELTIDGKRRRYLTSLEQGCTRAQLAKLYGQRWEIELGFREIKQTMLQSEPVMRSKQPELVLQELWGILIAYQLLRRWLQHMALRAKQPANRMAFEASSYAIINILRFANLHAPSRIPKQLEHLLQHAHLYVLPPRRQHRPAQPRAVKSTHSKYPKKKCQSGLN